MKIYENNLKQFIEIPENITEITNSYITEVESFGQLVNINNIVIGKVLEKEKHENADTLSVTKVDLGTHIEQIVCGASNVDQGQYVIVAKEGAILPGNFKIKKTKIRGVESNGMICSLQELGIDEKIIPEQFKQGIYYFSEPKEIGSNALKHLHLEGFVLELSITPNRSDLLSHYGYAQDLAAVLNKKINLPTFTFNEIDKPNPLTVKIESKQTNSYYARYFDNIEIKESPWWLKSFLLAMDCQPVNNVVDITNYILYTYGIPMHAFDAKKFNSTEIVVKDNTKAQKVITLDNNEKTINQDEIIITNGNEIMALGGIMGLANSMITNTTTNIILEVASFDPQTIRKTSKKLNLKSDSQLRFERGINEDLMIHALNHAASLLEQLANAQTYKGIASLELNKRTNPEIAIDFNLINQKIGETITEKQVLNYLERLNYSITKKDNNYYVIAPSYRNDINIFEDVLEEVVRLYGMDNVKPQGLLISSLGKLSTKQKQIRKTRHYLANIGLHEVITYSLLKEENVLKFNQIGEVVTVLKPMTSDKNALRQSLLNGMLDVVKYNHDRSVDNVNIFEIGNVFAKGIETKHLAVMITQPLNYNLWKKNKTQIDFYYISGILNNLMNLLNINYNLVPSNNESFHPYQQANIVVNDKIVGMIGKIHPKTYKKDCFAFELYLDNLEANKNFKYEQISKYPNVERDLAIVLKDNILISDLIKIIKQTGKNQLINVEIFDIYKGAHIEENHQSVAIRLTFNDQNKTLEKEDVDKIMNRIIKRIEYEFQGKIRS